MKSLSVPELQAFYEKHQGRVDYLKQYKKDYYKTEIGREKQKAASLRYYYRKNHKYHAIWNPEPELYFTQ